MERDEQSDWQLTLNRKDQLTVAGAAAALSLALGFKAGLNLRRWHKRRARQEKSFGKVGSLRVTLKVKTPRIKLSERS